MNQESDHRLRLHRWICLVGLLAGCTDSRLPAPPAVEASSALADESPPGPAPIEGPWGDLRGRFVYDGEPPKPAKLNTAGRVEVKEPLIDETLLVDPQTHGVANVVVYVRTKEVKVHPSLVQPAKQVELMTRDARFVPHVLLTRVGQQIVPANQDPYGHNFNYQPTGEAGISPRIPVKPEPVTPTRAQWLPTPVACNIHPWMKAYVLVRPNAYAAVTGPDGTFRIPLLPADQLEFQVWHEGTGYLQGKPEWEKGRFTLTIERGRVNDLGDIKLSPKLFQR